MNKIASDNESSYQDLFTILSLRASLIDKLYIEMQYQLFSVKAYLKMILNYNARFLPEKVLQ